MCTSASACGGQGHRTWHNWTAAVHERRWSPSRKPSSIASRHNTFAICRVFGALPATCAWRRCYFWCAAPDSNALLVSFLPGVVTWTRAFPRLRLRRRCGLLDTTQHRSSDSGVTIVRISSTTSTVVQCLRARTPSFNVSSHGVSRRSQASAEICPSVVLCM